MRLFRGEEDSETVYGTDPSAMAIRWNREGARYLHVVDLDGAFSGTPQNLGSLREILEKVTIPIEFGGGLRGIDVIRQVFKMGVDRVVLGTAAVRDLDFLRAAVGEFGRQIFVGLDAREGRLSVEGWKTDSGVRPLDIVGDLEQIGVGGIIYTDILTDGTLSGPNINALDEILGATHLRVIASGGVSSTEHLKRLIALRRGRLYGVIIGRALYTGDMKLSEALREAGGNAEYKRGSEPC